MADSNDILVAIDFSDGSRAAADAAVTLAKARGGALHLLSVHHMPASMAYLGLGVDASIPEGLSEAFGKAREELSTKLTALRAELADGDLEVHAHIGDGPPPICIVDTAKDLGAGVIVMGTHGRTGLPRLMLGSVAERVVRTAACPVMTVPLPEG